MKYLLFIFLLTLGLEVFAQQKLTPWQREQQRRYWEKYNKERKEKKDAEKKAKLQAVAQKADKVIEQLEAAPKTGDYQEAYDSLIRICKSSGSFSSAHSMKNIWNTSFKTDEKTKLTKAVLKYGDALMARAKEADAQLDAGESEAALKTYIEIKSYKRFKAASYSSQQLNKARYKPDLRKMIPALEREWKERN